MDRLPGSSWWFQQGRKNHGDRQDQESTAMIQTSQIIHGDCLEVMRGFPDACIDLVVTSPPYDNLRDYKGYRFDCPPVAVELLRVMKPGGVVVWVVQDAKVKGSRTLSSLEQAIAFRDAGWRVHDTMIWLKDSCPFPIRNAYQPVWEYMFAFSKGSPKTFSPIRKKNGQIKKLDQRSSYRQKNGSLLRKEPYTTPSDSIEHNVFYYAAGHCQSTRDSFSFEHPATFPEALAKDQIISWTKPGDVVLDPFAGSGTTLKMAEEVGRQWIGIDISADYCEIAKQRVKVAQPELKLQ